jgi:hypothetical protein
MQSKGSAVAFFVVLIVMCVGACAAFSALTSGRDSRVVAVESLTPVGETATRAADSSPIPSETPAQTPSPDSDLSTPIVPSATPVPPSTPTPLPSPTPVASPTTTGESTGPGPNPTQQGPYPYRVTRNEADCSAGGLIGGRVYDASGNGLAWANVYLYADSGWSHVTVSEGPPQAGKYEFAMGSDAALFHLVIVDDADQPQSRVVDVDYKPNCSQIVDWERVQ